MAADSDEDPDPWHHRLMRSLLTGPLGLVGGLVVAVVGLVLAVGLTLVVLSPILYPPMAGIVCYQPPGIPEWGRAFARWYYDLFSGVYPVGCG